MKCFERIIKNRLLKYVNLDEFQFAYKKSRSTKDACIGLDYFLRSHLEDLISYTRVLFFTSAFYTIVPSILLEKLESMNVPYYQQSPSQSFF